MMKYLYLIIATSLLAASCKKNKENYITEVIAHRGFSAIAPENTLSAFKEAIAINASYFELDVHQSKDGILMVNHDYSVNRTSSNMARGKVVEMSYVALQKVKVGYTKKFGDKFIDEKMPTLRESLLLAKGKIKVCVEIKVKNIEELVVKLIEELDMIHQVIVFGFNYETVKKVKEINPKLETLLLKNDATKQTIDDVLKIKANAIGVWHKKTIINKDFIEYAHQNGIKIFAYTVNEESRMKELIELKIDGIITNKPDLALRLTN